MLRLVFSHLCDNKFRPSFRDALVLKRKLKRNIFRTAISVIQAK